ncbi:sulfotransferase family protein [Leisingera aquaemixtae]|uniref:sulfotransferase family 2 domain-containing protein n=1 Tax=Leisingera aquaemixtae TaxID=1396826 RepID=UPI001C961B40|nr:sulfotransferase family 2 domain-containing protein [Leisingera aquaemixtae]MBY6065504.1 sulfotransferase family protein [Leisingera aquaemixtae]
MPVIKYKDVLLHFAHIPKCGGTSVERYVQGLKGVSLAFLDEQYVSNPPQQQHWNISSPQHIDGESLSRLFPKDFFTAFFTIVRHPIARLESAYKFQRLVERRIGSDETLDQFVKTRLLENVLTKGWMDGHFYPQSGFFYPGANYQVFKLEENGAEHAKAFIDAALFSNPASQQMTHSNHLRLPDSFDPGDLVLSDEGLAVAQKLYSMDFDNFNYDRQPAAQPHPQAAAG